MTIPIDTNRLKVNHSHHLHFKQTEIFEVLVHSSAYCLQTKFAFRNCSLHPPCQHLHTILAF